MTGNNEGARYIIERSDGQGIDLEGSLGIRPTIGFVVKYSGDNMVAWTGPSWWAHAVQGRRLGGLRLQASNMAKRYQSYLDSTGKRFEIEEKEKREAEMAEKLRLSAIKRKKMEAAEAMYDALAAIVNQYRSRRGGSTTVLAETLKVAEAALEKADG